MKVAIFLLRLATSILAGITPGGLTLAFILWLYDQPIPEQNIRLFLIACACVPYMVMMFRWRWFWRNSLLAFPSDGVDKLV